MELVHLMEGREGQKEKREGHAGHCKGWKGQVAWSLRHGVSRSLSSQCRRDRHQTHSPWGR